MEPVESVWTIFKLCGQNVVGSVYLGALVDTGCVENHQVEEGGILKALLFQLETRTLVLLSK